MLVQIAAAIPDTYVFICNKEWDIPIAVCTYCKFITLLLEFAVARCELLWGQEPTKTNSITCVIYTILSHLGPVAPNRISTLRFNPELCSCSTLAQNNSSRVNYAEPLAQFLIIAFMTSNRKGRIAMTNWQLSGLYLLIIEHDKNKVILQTATHPSFSAVSSQILSQSKIFKNACAQRFF